MCAETSDNTKRFVYEKEFSQFLTKRIANLGGSIKLQHITGHLSQVRIEVREYLGTSKSDIVNFIERNSDTFCLKNDKVTLVNSSEIVQDYDDDMYRIGSSLPNNISNGTGVIVKLFPAYGFIKVKDPLKTSVYFTARQYLNCGYDEQVNLIDHGLNVGAMVNFNAAKDKRDNVTTKYYATKVWKNDRVDIENNIIHKPRKNRETGLYDPVNLDGEGVIQKVFETLGFIAVNGDENNTVFFHKNRVVNYDNIVDLTKIFNRGDLVEFSAHRTTKRDAKARWEAIKVWSKTGKNINVKKQEKDTTSKSSSIISSNQSQSSSSPTHLNENLKQNSFGREMIHNQSGKISPRGNGSVIKFGENYTQLADGDSSVYYISGGKVTDISWEFGEGDKVKFDAVKIKSAPGWKAILVWVGEKPDIVLPTCLGDFSAFSEDEEIDKVPEDTKSVILSVSSRSSQKSISMKSEVNDLHKKDYIQRSLNGHMSPCSSLSNLSSSSESKLSGKSKEKLKREKSKRDISAVCKSVRNLRDIPHYANNYQIASSSKHGNDDELKSLSEQSSDINEDKTTQFSDLEFTESSEDSETNDNLKNISISENQVDEITNTASIKLFKGIIGEVTKVYATFAEVKCSELANPVAFFRSVFYIDEMSMEDLDLNDLREILKVKDTVYVSYFEIVDDSGQLWQKVSLVWKGSKSGSCINEMTPDDFIKENNLSVTLTDKPDDMQPVKQQQFVKKFLTVYDDISPEVKDEEHMSRTESCFDDDNDDSNEAVQHPVSPAVQEKRLTDEIKMFSDAISLKMLKNQDLFIDSEVDWNYLSAEIVDLVTEKFIKVKESSDHVLSASLTKESCDKDTFKTTCSTCGQKKAEITSQNINTDNKEVQTILTGEVLAQNIFIDC